MPMDPEPEVNRHLFKKDGRQYVFYLHKSIRLEGARQHLRVKITIRGGKVTDSVRNADIVLTNPNQPNGDLDLVRGAYYGHQDPAYHKVYVYPMSILTSWISLNEFRLTVPKKGKLPGAASRADGARAEYTDEDRQMLIGYLARRMPDPEDGGRSGQSIYKELCQHAKHDEDGYKWVMRHTWQSWRNQYVKNKQYFDAEIARLVNLHPEYQDKRRTYPKVRYPLRQRTAVQLEEEEEGEEDDEDEIELAREGQEQQNVRSPSPAASGHQQDQDEDVNRDLNIDYEGLFGVDGDGQSGNTTLINPHGVDGGDDDDDDDSQPRQPTPGPSNPRSTQRTLVDPTPPRRSPTPPRPPTPPPARTRQRAGSRLRRELGLHDEPEDEDQALRRMTRARTRSVSVQPQPTELQKGRGKGRGKGKEKAREPPPPPALPEEPEEEDNQLINLDMQAEEQDQDMQQEQGPGPETFQDEDDVANLLDPGVDAGSGVFRAGSGAGEDQDEPAPRIGKRKRDDPAAPPQPSRRRKVLTTDDEQIMRELSKNMKATVRHKAIEQNEAALRALVRTPPRNRMRSVRNALTPLAQSRRQASEASSNERFPLPGTRASEMDRVLRDVGKKSAWVPPAGTRASEHRNHKVRA